MQNRTYHWVSIALLISLLSGCGLPGRRAHREHLKASQLRSQELFAENEQLLLSQSQQQMMISSLEQERQGLAMQLGQTEQQLATANTRIDNLLAERSEIKDRYARALKDTTTDSFVTGGLGSQLPGFEYDPLTGLSKFPEDILFDLGSARLRPEALPVLREFVNQVNSSGASGLRVLIVGHTDDQAIARPATAQQHPTNWHLSTDRADEVVVELEQLGIAPERMAAMGYSRFQPLEASTSEPARQRNRRVELYVVPQSSNMTAWDPVRLLK